MRFRQTIRETQQRLQHAAVLLLFLLGTTWFSPQASAQLSPGTIQQLNNDLANDAVSAVEVFSAENAISTGTFHFDNATSPDVDFSTMRLPVSHSFGDPTNTVRPFIEAYLGYFQLHQQEKTGGVNYGDLNISSLTGTLGGGLHWRALDWLLVSPCLAAAYSHVWQDFNLAFQPGNPLAGVLGDWEANAFTLLPSLELAATWVIRRLEFGVDTRYTYLWVVGLHDTSSLIDIGSESQIWRSGIRACYHSGLRLFKMPLDFSGGFAVYELYGHLSEADFVNHFYEARLGIGLVLPKPIVEVRRLTLSGGYYFYDRFSGYSIGLSLDF